MRELPKGWAIGSLVNFMTPRGEKVLPSAFPKLPFIGMDHVEAHTTRILGSIPAGKLKSSAVRFYTKDVLYGRLRPYLNKVAQPNFDGLASAEFIIFSGNKLIDPAFLRYRLNARDFVSFAISLNAGDRPRVNFDQISDFEILVPPLNEQRRIVAKIETMFDQIDKGVESLKTARAMLDLYRQSLLKSAFEGRLTAEWRAQNAEKLEDADTLLSRIKAEREARHKAALKDWAEDVARWRADGQKGKRPTKPKQLYTAAPVEKRELQELPTIPSAWEFSRLGLYIDWIEAGKSFKCLETEPGSDQVGLVKVSAVSWGEYDESESKTCLDEKKINESWFIHEGDFLLSRANTIELVGASVIVKKVTKCIMLSDKTLRIHFTPEDRRFFLHYLRSPYGRAEIEARSSGNQESMRNIGQDRIKNIIIPVCNEAEQTEIVRLLDERFDAANALEAEIDTALTRAEALRQSTLKKAFTGQLVPQDPNDEPASVLLQRIHAEQTKPPKTLRKIRRSA